MMSDFQNGLISRISGVFSRVFFLQNNSNVIKEPFFCMFFLHYNFSPKLTICKGYSLCMMAYFQNRLISGLFGVFLSGVLHRTTLIRL